LAHYNKDFIEKRCVQLPKDEKCFSNGYAQALTPGLYSQELGLALHDQVFGVTEVSSSLPD